MQRCTALLHRQKVAELGWAGGGQPAAAKRNIAVFRPWLRPAAAMKIHAITHDFSI